jgi:outer membrane lipopolysaccharide assembly protein LptE/RlpB
VKKQFAAIPMFVSIALLVLLQSCGFQLRGADLGTLDLDYRIVGNINGGASPTSLQFLALLNESLEKAGAKKLSAADTLIEINGLSREEVAGAVNARVRLSEKSIVFVLNYRIIDIAGNIIIPDQRLEIERTFRIDRNNLLASNSEQKIIEAQLLRNLALKVTTGLGVVLSDRSALSSAGC